jgi:hypothetical protein
MEDNTYSTVKVGKDVGDVPKMKPRPETRANDPESIYERMKAPSI